MGQALSAMPESMGCEVPQLDGQRAILRCSVTLSPTQLSVIPFLSPLALTYPSARQPPRQAAYWDSQTFVGSIDWMMGTNTALWTRLE